MIIKNSKALRSLLGKKVKCMQCGLLVEGTVIDFQETDHQYQLTVDHSDKPVRSGTDVFKQAHPFQRKEDNWGSMMHVEIVNEKGHE